MVEINQNLPNPHTGRARQKRRLKLTITFGLILCACLASRFIFSRTRGNISVAPLPQTRRISSLQTGDRPQLTQVPSSIQPHGPIGAPEALADNQPKVLGSSTFSVQVLGTTATQGIIAYTAPDANPCTVQVSENSSLSPLVPDIDPTIFANSDLDNRVGSISNGTAREFVIGQRAALDRAQPAPVPALRADEAGARAVRGDAAGQAPRARERPARSDETAALRRRRRLPAGRHAARSGNGDGDRFHDRHAADRGGDPATQPGDPGRSEEHTSE